MAVTLRSPFDTPLLDSPVLRSRLGCVAMAALLYFGMALRVNNLDIPAGRSPDEVNYTAQAQRLLHEGGAGLKGIAEEYLRDPASRLAGPPTRAGYLWALAGTMWLTGHHDEQAGVILSCAASIGSLLLVALIGIRFFPPWATIYALLFFAIFPAELELARRTWADALVGLLGLAVVYCAMEITRDSTRRFWQAAFLMAGCLGAVVKEFGAVTFALCAVWVVGLQLWRGQRRDALLVTVSGLTGAALCLLWLSYGVGGLAALVRIVSDWRGAHVANHYAIEFQSGPPWHLLRALWVVSPGLGVLLLVALAGALYYRRGLFRATTPRRMGQLATPRTVLALFSIANLGVSMLLPNWLNLRYVSVAFAPLILLSGGALDSVRQAVAGNFARPLQRGLLAILAAGVFSSAISDYRRFSKFFVNEGLGDLSVKLILDRAGMYSTERLVKRRPTAENYLELCRGYAQNWRYGDSVAACRNALRLRPEFAEAYEQMAVAYLHLEEWSGAATAAEQALRLKPSSAPARQSLEEARAAKAASPRPEEQ